MFDHSIAFRVGRHPSITMSKITQTPPLPADLSLTGLNSPFPYAVQQHKALGRLLLHWNAESSSDETAKAAYEAYVEILEMYANLPADVEWSDEK
jgi:hypothetical protein